MPRYVNVFETGPSREQAWETAVQYLRSEGFDYIDERGEMVWRKGTGALVNPQFVRIDIEDDGRFRVEAWVASVSVLPGVYSGELDPMSGLFGAGPRLALKPRVLELERRLGAAPGSGATSTPPMVAAGWHPDPTGRHEHRYWDGARWTASVADGGESWTDPHGAA
jgi:hypothetical protein